MEILILLIHNYANYSFIIKYNIYLNKLFKSIHLYFTFFDLLMIGNNKVNGIYTYQFIAPII